jgi:hypothetical protein
MTANRQTAVFFLAFLVRQRAAIRISPVNRSTILVTARHLPARPYFYDAVVTRDAHEREIDCPTFLAKEAWP